jgi:hypothetical protein
VDDWRNDNENMDPQNGDDGGGVLPDNGISDVAL